MSPADPVIIAIVDDHPIVIEGLKSLLKNEAAISTVSFTTGAGILAFVANNKVDVVLLDVMLPDINGIEVCKDIKKIAPATLVLAVSNQAERSIILQMLHNGASGYVLKNAGAEELLNCIQEAIAGDIAFSREVKEIMTRLPEKAQDALPLLTKREKQVLSMVADGQTTQQIADALFISPFTVETHRRNLLQKMEVKNMAELIRIAVENKWV